MSRTPHKDELIRVAALLGLPDDTPPDEVAEAVKARLEGVQAMTDEAAKVVKDLREALEDAATVMEKAREDLQAKATTGDMVGLRATVLRVCDDLREGFRIAEERSAP